MPPDEAPAQDQPGQRPRYGRGRRRSRPRRPQPAVTAAASAPAPAGAPAPEPAAIPTGGLACDAMLGRLARELRLLGMDVEYNRTVSGMQAYKGARAAGRTLLTRNKRMINLPGVVFVTSQNAAEQVAQVRGGAPPAAAPAAAAATTAPAAPRPAPRPEKPPQETPFGRCLECNGPLEKISRDQARPSVPFFVYQIHHEFKRCPKCRRVYWPGNHVQDMRERVPTREGRRSGPRQSQSRRPRRG